MESLKIQKQISIQKLFYFERCGRYDEAMRLLDVVWTDKSDLPNVEGFGNVDAAELLLRCGSIIGFLGHSKQIPFFQEYSRNILTKAREKFIDIYNEEKIAECENHLALTYTRKGETSDAQIWLDESYSHTLPKSCDSRLYSHIIQSIITNIDKDYNKTIENFELCEYDFIESGDSYLNGAMFANVGNAHKRLGLLSKSLTFFKSSKKYYRESQNILFLAAVENDIATTYLSLQHYSKAHKAVDCAMGIFKKAKDKTKLAITLDTKALIFLNEKKYDDSLDAVNEAIKVLEKSEEFDYLVETLLTKTKILVKLNKLAEASICLSRAMELARVNISEDKVNKLAASFESFVKETKAPIITSLYKEKELNDEGLELVLPSELSHFEEIEGVWIKNHHLESSGLKKDSLAIIVKEKVNRGDLVAILERGSEEVICGFYDIDFGIICLDAKDRKPQLFDESEIQILGKIIGVADKSEDSSNKMHVKPL